MQVRAPVVAIMGHIDHGKSSLLDYIRNTNVVDSEAGGITQHISAYEADHNGRSVTFLDTPGHEAFAATRERGASIADIAVLVVAADDGVKEQTIGAYEFIKESKIPFVVAINKIDKNGADIEKAKNSLLEHGIYLEGMGGDITFAEVSALKGTGVSELLDTILLAADVEELQGDRNALATGFVLESTVDPRKGISATLVIKNGSLKNGQYVLSDNNGAPLRIIEDFAGNPIREASFSKPVRVVGFESQPRAGSDFTVFDSKKDAQKFIKEIEQMGGFDKEVTDTETTNKVAIPLIIKADVQGSVDAIRHQIAGIKSPTAYYKILLAGVGEISESDIKAAGADKEAVIVGFNVPTAKNATDTAETYGMSLKSFNIIYELTEYLEKILEERRPRVVTEKTDGSAKIIRVFSWTNKGGVIGGRVKEGRLELGAKVKILRRDRQVGTAIIRELQKGKQDAQFVEMDEEFGSRVDTRFDIAEGDTIEAFRVIEE